MKKLTTLWMMMLMLLTSMPAMAAMSKSKMRENARFLTDRMAYELRLSEMQYDDVYEVNYDFINNVRYIMDDVVAGFPSAVDRYYEYLNYRNDDLRWILSASQYRKFMGVDYFYRPIYTTVSDWHFRIYKVYRDIHHFYYAKPRHYKTYNGAHCRLHFGNKSYYKHHRKNPYRHEPYRGKIDLRPDKRSHVAHRPATKVEVPRRKPAKEVKGKVEKRRDTKRVVVNNNGRSSKEVSSRTGNRERSQEGGRTARVK